MIEAQTPTRAQNLLLRTPPAQAVYDPIQTAAGTLNKFFFEYKLNRGKLMAGQLEITPRLADCQPHQLLTRDGKVTKRHVVRQERQRKVAQPKPWKLIFFLCFTNRTGGPQKDFSIVSSMTPSNGETDFNIDMSVSFVVQLATGEKERGDRGPAPRRSAADAAPKKNGDQANRARAYAWSHEASVDRALHGERSWEHGSGTPAPLDHH